MNRRERRKAKKYNSQDKQRLMAATNKPASDSDIDGLMAEAARLYEAGDISGAQSSFELILKMNPGQADALFGLGVLSEQESDLSRAKQNYRAAVESTPSHAPSLVNLANILRSERQYPEAIKLLERAANEAPEVPLVHNNFGIALHQCGRTEDAILVFQKALELDPQFVEASCNLGAVFADLERFEEAIECFDRALEHSPDNSVVLANLGNAYNGANRIKEAISALERAIESDSSNAFAYAKFATLNERLNHLDMAREQIAKAKALDPNNPEIQVMNGIIAGRDKSYEVGIREIEAAIPALYSPNILCRAHFEAGHQYDQMNDTESAFKHYRLGNSLIEEKAVCLGTDRNDYLDEIKANIDHVKNNKNDYLVGDNIKTNNSPVFIVGFPRSGTTLIEQILDSHPNIDVLDEKPIVEEIINYFKSNIGKYPENISLLNCDNTGQIIEQFYNAVGKYMEVNNENILAYKMPLNMVHAGFIYKIFPDAKFIFTTRHPCDACLSCFMQHFTLNRAMTHFTSLQSTAEFYSLVVGLWQSYSEILPLQSHALKYESLVDNFEETVLEMLKFVGVDWDEAVLAYDKHARGRTVMTPSYSQVTQPIYKSSKERWRRYSREMEPVLPILEPFIKSHGYSSINSPETKKA